MTTGGGVLFYFDGTRVAAVWVTHDGFKDNLGLAAAKFILAWKTPIRGEEDIKALAAAFRESLKAADRRTHKKDVKGSSDLHTYRLCWDKNCQFTAKVVDMVNLIEIDGRESRNVDPEYSFKRTLGEMEDFLDWCEAPENPPLLVRRDPRVTQLQQRLDALEERLDALEARKKPRTENNM